MTKPRWYRNLSLWWQKVTIKWRLRNWFKHHRCEICGGWEW